jgi:hypothetical protein
MYLKTFFKNVIKEYEIENYEKSYGWNDCPLNDSTFG